MSKKVKCVNCGFLCWFIYKAPKRSGESTIRCDEVEIGFREMAEYGDWSIPYVNDIV